MGEKDCLECNWTPICKMYETLNTLIDECHDNDVNMIKTEGLTRLVAGECMYYEYHKDK